MGEGSESSGVPHATSSSGGERENTLEVVEAGFEAILPLLKPKYGAVAGDLRIVNMYTHCLGLAEGARCLMSHRMIEEAAVLARQVFVGSLWLDELDRSEPSRRLELLLGWQLSSLKDHERQIAQGVRLGAIPSDQESAVRSNLAASLVQIGEEAKNAGVSPKPGGFPHAYELSESLQRTRDFVIHNTLHHYVHGSPISHAGRSKLVKSRQATVMSIALHAGDPDLMLAVGALTLRSVAIARQASGRILGWEDIPLGEHLCAIQLSLECKPISAAAFKLPAEVLYALHTNVYGFSPVHTPRGGVRVDDAQ